MKTVLIASFILLTSVYYCNAQVNAYAKVTGISGKILSLSNINESFHTFVAGDQVIIMQMKDDVIGDVTNNSTFGGLGVIGSAGLYEIGQIASRTATSITLTASLTNSYNTGANSAVQIISYRQLGNPDFTTTANIVALDWDGNIGGVVAIKVNGILTLNHDISADAKGFRGGAKSANQGTVNCETSWITSNSGLSGEKGEGIYVRTDVNYQYGRAKILNGGGGGNRHNAGGGGGGNVTAGGEGGPGFTCTGSPVGGQGGISLISQISANRIFMGGGGGGGHQNNNVGTPGANGGGIILISAKQIVTTGTCANHVISANGGNSSSANNDGSGGGGAGGTIVFNVGSFGIVSGCQLTVTANGGAGGSVTDATIHGAGGGGGQGIVMFSGSVPSNVSVATNNGTSGCNNNSSPCSNQASAPSGTNGTGINLNIAGTPLPVSLMFFTAIYNNETSHVVLKWVTASEINNDYFTIDRSFDGHNFYPLISVPGSGNTSTLSKYQVEDTDMYESQCYYRLSQTDLDGKQRYLKVITVAQNSEVSNIWMYPNPVDAASKITISVQSPVTDNYTVSFVDLNGIEVLKSAVTIEKGIRSIEIQDAAIVRGIYTVHFYSSKVSFYRKIVVF